MFLFLRRAPFMLYEFVHYVYNKYLKLKISRNKKTGEKSGFGEECHTLECSNVIHYRYFSFQQRSLGMKCSVSFVYFF